MKSVPVEKKCCEKCHGYTTRNGYFPLCNDPNCPCHKSVPVEKWVAKEIREALEAEETVGGYVVPYAFMENVEKVISKAIQAARIEAKEEERKRIVEEVEKLGGYSNFKSAVLATINNHQ